MTVETQQAEGFHVGPVDDPDRYQLGEPVGAGAEGTLYRGSLAIGPELTLDVAIKMLHPHHRPNLESWRRRWGNQVELLRSLRAPGLVAVRDGFVGPLPHPLGAGGSAETLYLVMNFIDGEPIDVWAERNRSVPDREKLRLLLPVAAGLDLMHSGAATGGTPVIHGDVKPGNVLISGESTILVDFGMMRSLPGGQRHTSVTGTVNYLAPEVLADGVYAPAADRYAFGGVAYYLLTGRHPTTDLGAMRVALEAGDRDGEVVDHVMAMFAPAAERPVALANWCAQLRDSSLAPSDLPGDPPLAPSRPPMVRPPVAPVPVVAPSLPVGPFTSDDPARLTVVVSPIPAEPGGPVDTGRPAPPAGAARVRRSWPWSRRPSLAAMAVFVVVVVAAGLAAVWRPTAPSGATRTYAFAAARYPDGLVVSRVWSTGGRRGRSLHSALRIFNESNAPVTSSVDEVITKSVAANIAAIKFSPPPAQVVRDDPVVRYELRGLPPGEATTFAYDVSTHPPTGTTADLEGWAAQQTADDAGYQHGRATLAALRVFPPDVTATVGDRVHLDATGTMSDGQPATPAVLAAVAWTSSDPRTVEVASGTLTAQAHGTATITAGAGPLRADIRVLVLAPNRLAGPTTASSSPPIPSTAKPTVTAPPVTTPGTTPSSSTPATGPSSTSPPVTSPPATGPTPTTTTIRTTTTTTPLTVTLDDADQTGVDRFTYAPPGSWQVTTGATGRYKGTGHFDPVGTGDYFVLSFSGVQATWMGAKASGQGIALVSVDGGPDQPCDTYGPGRIDQLAIFTTPVLAQGPHTLKVTISGTQNANSTGIGLQVDFALIQTTSSTTRQAGCGV